MAEDAFTASVGPDWPGFLEIKNIMIFGASYCDVGYSSSAPTPTPEEPLGVKFPGTPYTGPLLEPNWVGHLVSKRKAEGRPVLVYDYAVGGSKVYEVAKQVHNEFIPYVGTKPDWASWKSNDSLFVTWVGINDCAYNFTHEYDIKDLFQIQEDLYQAGARNFLLVDVPPMHRSPAFADYTGSDASESYENWNSNLRIGATTFQKQYPDASVLIFPAWDTFTRILDSPEAFAFSSNDLARSGGGIWMDSLHPTSKMHEYIAQDMLNLLNGHPIAEMAD